MTDLELLKYAMFTTLTTATLVFISDFLFWLCEKADEEVKENKVDTWFLLLIFYLGYAGRHAGMRMSRISKVRRMIRRIRRIRRISKIRRRIRNQSKLPLF